jgi:hypothetical protein
VTGITSDFGIAIGQTNADGSALSLIVEPAGTLSEIPIATPSTPTVIATGGPGVGVIGPDGCLYSAKSTIVYRIAAAAGGCSFTPTSPAPAINLTPATVAPNPAQGSAQTFTATLHNVTPLSGVPVMFTVEGVNEEIKLVDTDSNGNAVLSYTAAFAGTDKVTASAAPSTTTLTSNTVPVTWTAGKHVSVLSLNASPQGALVNQPVTLVASLADGSASPVAALSGQAVSLTLGGATCTATTGTTGLASCAITPTQPGSTTLTASFAGGSQVTAATASIGFRVSVASAPPPTVTIVVTAKAGGGGALSWYAILALGLLVLLRLEGAMGGSMLAGASRTRGGGGTLIGAAILLAFTLVFATAHTARADQPTVNQPATSLDPFYVGIRVGGMPLRENSGKLDQGLASLGFGDVSATSDTSGIAGTVFVGYEFTPHAALELGYTYRDSTTAHLNGTIPSTSKLTPLLQDTAELTRGYGNIISLSYSGRFEVLPRFSLVPRLGGFFWATKVSATGLDDSIDTTHEGGGITAGLTAAYRLWRGLELGVSVDHFRGFPNNIATLYAGTLEWRFGR